MEIQSVSFIIIGIVLGIQSIWDLKKREIPIGITMFAGAVGLVSFWIMKREITEVLMGLIPGLMALLLGRITREAIGYGDGFLILALGFFYPLYDLLGIIMMALSFAGIMGLILLVIFQKKGKYEMPFVPFLFVAWAIDFYLRL